MLLCGAGCSVLSACLLLYCVGVISAEQQRERELATSPSIILPYAVPGTNLVVQKVVCYEGPFLEDNKNDEVVDVAAIVLQNVGTVGVEEAWIELCWQDGCYRFEAYMIPAGESVLVCDKSRQLFASHAWKSCAGYNICSDYDWTYGNLLSVEEIAMGELAVTNISDCTIEEISVIYKTYLSPPNVYIGGYFNRVQIPKLQPGETISVAAWGYAADNSKVIYIGCDQVLQDH